MPNLKVTFNLLTVCCVVITGVICTVLTVTSGDDALNKTKKSRSESVDTCFMVGKDTVNARTTDYLSNVRSTTIDKISKFFEKFRHLSESLVMNMMTTDDQALAESWPFLESKRSTLYSLYDRFNTVGLTGLAITNRKFAQIIYSEDEETIRRPRNEYHHHFVVQNNGSDYDASTGISAVYRGAWGTVKPGYGTHYPELGYISGPDCDWSAVKTNGSEPSPLCSQGDNSAFFYGLLPLGMMVPPGTDGVTWSPPLVIGNYVAVFAFGTYTSRSDPNQDKLGMVYAAVDIRGVTDFLSGLVLPGKTTIYTTMRSSWLGTDLILTGVSRGKSVYVQWDEGEYYATTYTIPPSNATDPIISETAKYIDSVNGTYDAVRAMGDIHEYTILNESFFLQVVPYEERGIDWWVVVTVDRKYVLGQVDEQIAVTKTSIDKASKEIDDQLKMDRIVLVILICVTACFLLVLSFLLILKVTGPILKLRAEMASVAIMKLEEVEEHKGLSILNEVAGMQLSFFTMVTNLKEYRNYMPQSVLCVSDNTDDGDGDESGTLYGSVKSEEDTPKSCVSRHSRHSHSSSSFRANEKALAVFVVDIRNKKVSSAVVNVVGFLAGKSDHMKHHEQFIQNAIQLCHTHRGVPEGFSGDRVTFLFNAMKTCTSHGCAAVRTCKEISAYQKTAASLNLSMAVSSGKSLCGNMGCEGMMKYTTIGHIVPLMHVMERLNRVFSTELLVCAIAHNDVGNYYYARLEEQIKFPKFSTETKLAIYSVGELKKVEEEEWMYQVEAGEQQDPNYTHNAAMKLYFTADYEEALALASSSSQEADTIAKIKAAQVTSINYLESVAIEFL